MKNRVREAVFNLVGPNIKGKLAIDLFAGTGAIGLEALSRGASAAILLEQHFPSADLIKQNVATLGVAEVTQVMAANTFTWLRRLSSTDLPASVPWVVFCSPPYEFYVSRCREMRDLTKTLISLAPEGSLFVAESDLRFDFEQFSDLGAWDVRDYPPARVGLLECFPPN